MLTPFTSAAHTVRVNGVNNVTEVDPVIDMQLLNDALMTVAVVVGLAVLVSVAFVAAAALTHRQARRRGIREIERLLAALADRRDSPAAR
jgi:hypothetical protein